MKPSTHDLPRLVAAALNRAALHVESLEAKHSRGDALFLAANEGIDDVEASAAPEVVQGVHAFMVRIDAGEFSDRDQRLRTAFRRAAVVAAETVFRPAREPP